MYDSAGSYQLVVGSEAIEQYRTGSLWRFKNIDQNLNGTFTLVDSAYQQIWEGSRLSIAGGDINNDGRMDLAIGNYAGGVAFYMGDTLATSIPFLAAPLVDFSLYPNPASNFFSVKISAEKISNQPYHFKLYSLLGELLFQQKLTQENSTLCTHLPAGVYIAEVTKGEMRATKKLMLIK
jgi:hypothetical protein